MSFSSDIKTGLPQTPVSKDPSTYKDLLNLHNAVHILSQQINVVRSSALSPNDPNASPADALPFRHWVWLEADVDIQNGNLVTVVDRNMGNNEGFTPGRRVTGVITGASAQRNQQFGSGQVNPATNNYVLQLQGVALSDAARGEKVKVGIGPAVIGLESVNINQKVYGLRYNTNFSVVQKGGFYLSFSGQNQHNFAVVGIGIAPGFMYFNWPLWSSTGVLG